MITSTGVMGESARWFVHKILARAKACSRSFIPIGQPQVAFTWNTLSAAAYWSSRVSLDALFTSSHVINEIIVRDVAAAAECAGRRPNLDPNATHRGGLPAGVMASRARGGVWVWGAFGF